MENNLRAQRTHVENLWRLLQGELVDMAEMQDAVRGLYEHDDNQYLRLFVGNRASLVSIYNRESLRDLKLKWQPMFSSVERLDAQRISEFGVDLRNIIENPDAMFGDQNFASASTFTEATSSDSRVYRPPGMMRGWTLTLTVAGGGDYNCVRTQLTTQPGDLVLHSPDALYDYKRDPSAREWQHYWLYLQNNSRFLRWLQWPEIGPNIYHLRVPSKDREEILELFSRAMASSWDSDEVSQALLENQIEEVLIRCYGLTKKSKPVTADSRVEDAKRYITTHLTSDFTIHDVAGAVDLSKARLSSLFKQHTHQTVFQWRDERRITMASQLFLETDLSVKEIARRVGYQDPLYFSRCFKKLACMSPTEFRDR